MADVSEQVDRVEQELADYEEIDVDRDEVADRLETLVNDYAVPQDEARRSVVRKIGERHDIDVYGSGGSSGTSEVQVSEIDRDGQWVTVEVTVDRLWDASHESIAQTGLVGDETGTIKFTSWEDANQPTLEDGESYRLANVVTDEYEGQLSIQLQDNSTVERIDEDIDVGQETVTHEGVIVNIQSGSGLVKRCPDDGCTRVLQNGRCSEHGDVDGEFDLRIKAVLDDGRETQLVIFNRETTEELTDYTLEAAKEQAKQQLNTEVVVEEMTPQVVNQYYEIEGPQYGNYCMVNEFDRLGAPESDRRDSLLEAV